MAAILKSLSNTVHSPLYSCHQFHYHVEFSFTGCSGAVAQLPPEERQLISAAGISQHLHCSSLLCHTHCHNLWLSLSQRLSSEALTGYNNHSHDAFQLFSWHSSITCGCWYLFLFHLLPNMLSSLPMWLLIHQLSLYTCFHILVNFCCKQVPACRSSSSAPVFFIFLVMSACV